MSSAPPPRILIATAGFGDGHNSAAKNLGLALTPDAEVLIADPCAKGAPILNESLRSAYRVVTTHAPQLWARVYRGVEKRDFSKRQFQFMRKAETALDTAIESFAPDVLVSTYPLYPYFMARHRESFGEPYPIITVVTDSIEINASWRNAPTDYWLVTDQETKRRLVEKELEEHRIIETGFPVSPKFADLPTIAPDDPIGNFRILYFPTSKRPTVRRITRALLETPFAKTTVTIVLGRNFRKLYARALEMKKKFPGRVRILGWSKRVPELLTNHHLVVGKAGGATVHEALAASTPMIIHHLVPGQEEGNLELLKRHGGGILAESTATLSIALQDLLADNASLWRRQKRSLSQYRRPNASRVAAQFIINQTKKA